MRADSGVWLLLVSSGVLNVLLVLHSSFGIERLPAGASVDGRQLAECKARAARADEGAQGDCASVACPALFQPTPAVYRGASRYKPFFVDTRFRLRAPSSMLELTRMLYGGSAAVGEPYRDYPNTYGKKLNLKYQWTQINQRILTEVMQRLDRRPRLFVEVGSFTGRSSVLVGEFLRDRFVPTKQHPEPPALLCIDTWLGDMGMTLGAYLTEEMDKHHGQPRLYHQWLVNIIASNLTQTVLPLMATSFMGAKILSHKRLKADIIYLDSAHEQRETFFELTAFWGVLAPGGLIVGDDLNWADVMHDAQLFARTHGTAVKSFNGCHEQLLNGTDTLCVWYLKKST